MMNLLFDRRVSRAGVFKVDVLEVNSDHVVAISC